MLKDMMKPLVILILAVIVFTAITGCGSVSATDSADGEIERPEGWTRETHGNDVDPDYDVVFPQDTVNRITITIDPSDWEGMQANMADLYGEPGSQSQRQLPGMGNNQPGQEQFPAFNDELPGSGNLTQGIRPGLQAPFQDGENGPGREGFAPGSADFNRGDFPGMSGFLPGSENATPGMLIPDEGALLEPETDGIPGWFDMTGENPDWFPATVEFNGLTWTNVGFRYKGNSSLTSAWRSNSEKVPFKLDFDEFEDEYPEIDDQRFYGFKQISFSNAFSDSTYMHDAIAADILQDAGLVAAETAYYEVVLDYGEGEVNLGLYVAIEVIDDTVIDKYFDSDSGNIYEGDGRGVSLADGTAGLIEESFQKENNQGDADWSDIEELYDILHSATRVSDPESWREELESVFDVDSFLKWLGIAGIIQHWDTYGSMTHNFYLYDNPETGQLTWISWDHNQVLSGSGMAAARGRPVAGLQGSGTATLSRDEVTAQWPLIRYLLDDPVYYERYLESMEETLDDAFDPDVVAEKCETLAELIFPYLNDSESVGFVTAVEGLISQVYQRYQVAGDFLAEVE